MSPFVMSPFVFRLQRQDLPTLVAPLAKELRKGDFVALRGDLGAGKTAFAGVLIQALVGQAIETPSPTFTLVQVYDSPQGDIWHCDLYRLKDPEEVFEIGLEDAFHQAICLIEWPERLGHLLPRRRVDIAFEIIDDATREITIALVGPHESLHARLASSI